MTALLEEVFKKASTLPESFQDEIARELLEELEWEIGVEEPSALDKMAEQALKEFDAGLTIDAGWDKL